MRSFLPSPAPAVKRSKSPRFLPRLSDDPDKRSMQIGIGATILIHILLIVLMPEKFENDLVGSFMPEQRSVSHQPFSIEMAPDEFVDMNNAPKETPMKFVETNPDAPDNEPDHTMNFGAQNQQASQETKAKVTGGDRPELEGRKDLEPTQVVSGNLSQPTPPVPMPPPEQEKPVAEKATPQVAREQSPLPGMEKYIGDNPDTFGSNIAKIAPHPEDVAQQVEGTRNAPLIQGPVGQKQTVDRNHPRPRPQLNKRARPALFAENKIGTANIGPMAVDARWSNYGQYLQKMLEAVQITWEKLIQEGRTYPTPGSVVTVKFIMDSTGAITQVVHVESGMAGQQAEGYCIAAIMRPSPYGKWSDDMVAVLGDKQEMTFAFFYQ